MVKINTDSVVIFSNIVFASLNFTATPNTLSTAGIRTSPVVSISLIERSVTSTPSISAGILNSSVPSNSNSIPSLFVMFAVYADVTGFVPFRNSIGSIVPNKWDAKSFTTLVSSKSNGFVAPVKVSVPLVPSALIASTNSVAA